MTGFYAFYTSLVRTGDGSASDPYAWMPVNLTYVSRKAVEDVFDETPHLSTPPLPPSLFFLKDVRVELASDERRIPSLLKTNWPFVPGQSFGGQWSEFGCAVMLARTAMSLFGRQHRRLTAAEEDDWTKFTWAMFGPTGQDERVVKAAAMSMGANPVTPFAQLCRSEKMVDAIWNHSSGRFLMTIPRFSVWENATFREESGRVHVAKEGWLEWDGVEPSSLGSLADISCFLESKRQNSTTYRIFNNPRLLQVDFTPSHMSKCRCETSGSLRQTSGA